MSESRAQSLIQMAISRIRGRVFRNQVGTYKICKCESCRNCRKGRYVSSGLAPGSSDLIGWMPIKITDDMVGKELAVFTAIEVKSETGKPTIQQANFIQAVKENGGISLIARSEKEAIEKINSFDLT